MPPSTDWKETVPPDEPARFEALAELLHALQKKEARGGPASRALHAKQHVAARAELVVAGGLPLEARAGLFAEPRTFRAFVRFSNGSGRRQADQKPDVRGLAIKVLGVPGKKVIPGMEDARTQDFLAIPSAATPFAGPEEFVAFARAGVEPWRLPSVAAKYGVLHTARVLKQFLASASAPVSSLAAITFHSALPVAWGKYAAKFRFEPEAQGGGSRSDGGPDRLGAELAGRLRAGPVAFAMRVQMFRDEATTPIEDASRAWSDEDAPPVTVARLVVQKQDVTSAEGRALAERVATMSFDPWHAMVEHRPLGAMMRARNYAYRVSTKERGAGVEPTED